MRCIDVFHGDADGLCALRQLRLAEPCASTLVTGAKRDVELLRRVSAGAGDRVTVLDVSLERNRIGLEGLLAVGAHVQYFDHHFAGEIPRHPALDARIDTELDVCTGVLVDRHVGGRFRAWAVVAAFGDSLTQTALRLGGSLGLGAVDLAALRELGEALNYNAYGESTADLLVQPRALYHLLAEHEDPFGFIERQNALYRRLNDQRRADMDAALNMEAHWRCEGSAIYLLPDSPWARRVCGAFANFLASVSMGRPQAVLAPVHNGFRVSVRMPEGGADDFCRRFPHGGGRRVAGGIQRLAPEKLNDFVARFSSLSARREAPA